MPEVPELDLSAEAGGEGGINEDVVIEPTLKTPDITPVQLVAGIPVVAELLHSFGVYDLSQAQQDSLTKAALYAMAIVGADAVIRLGRNLRKRI